MRRKDPPAGNGHGTAVLACFLGWTLDAFDFFLVIFALTAIAKEFGTSDAAIALSITLTLAFRPVGALVFGLLADRYGRRLPLMIDLVFYSIVEVLSGLAPSYASFLVLRALFGVGMGGEWGVGASLAMEKVPVRLRGVLSSWSARRAATRSFSQRMPVMFSPTSASSACSSSRPGNGTTVTRTLRQRPSRPWSP